MNREVHVRFWESAGLRCPAPLDYRQEYHGVAEALASIGEFYRTDLQPEAAPLGARLPAAGGVRTGASQCCVKVEGALGSVWSGIAESIGPMCRHFFLPLGRVPLSGRTAARV